MTQDNNITSIKANNKNTNNLFCYDIDGMQVVIESGIKIEALEQSIIYPIPNAPKWYLGVTSLRGDILTVVNMHFLLNKPQNNGLKRLLKMEHPDFPALTIAVDNLPYQKNIDELTTNNKKNNDLYPEWITSSSKQNEHIFLFADHSILFQAMQNNLLSS